MRMPLLIPLLLGNLFFANAAIAETPCDFKGLSVGDRMSPAEAMSTLGISKYKVNPKFPPFMQQVPNIDKYGPAAAGELLNWKIGPYCDGKSCVIPYGVEIGNENIPTSVFVAINQGRVTEIDVSFGAIFWDEILPILNNKYGNFWNIENDKLGISDYGSNRYVYFDRVDLTHKLGGRNPKTKDRCEIFATSYDEIFTHHDPLGKYHSIFIIRLVSKNF
jgi:hypothetical protein